MVSLSEFSAFQKWIEQGQKQLDIFSQQLEPINKLATDSFSHFSSILGTAVKEISERTIETKIQGEGSSRYVTNITNMGDVLNEFPSKEPEKDDIYWSRHTQLVDSLLTNRQATIDKVIHTVGTTIKGVINPISFSPTDLIQVINSIKGTSVKK
jgi:hypothetical protein